MALFDFFRKFNFFKGKNTENLREEDLDFQKWIAAHRDWRRRLVSYIEGSSSEQLDENVICCDDRCDLGKWIYGNGGQFYGDLGTFRQIREDHTNFHRCAGQVVQIYKGDGEQAARKKLNSDFDLYSIRVVSGLENLERQVKQ